MTSGSATRAQGEDRWQASAAYADMTAALASVGWTDYATAIAERREHPVRWQRFHLEWERRMQARVGIVVQRPVDGLEREAPDSRTTDAFNRRAGRARHHRAAQ